MPQGLQKGLQLRDQHSTFHFHFLKNMKHLYTRSNQLYPGESPANHDEESGGDLSVSCRREGASWVSEGSRVASWIKVITTAKSCMGGG